MSEIILLRGERAIVDGADFAQIIKHRWYLSGGYPVARIEGRTVHLHVFLLGRAPAGFHIDHINRNKLDNRRANLRVVTAAENIRNRRSYVGEGNPFFGKTHSAEVRARTGAFHARPVLQLSRDGALIKEWPSAMEAQRALGISNGNIACAISGTRKTAGGFLWRRK